MFNFFDEIKDKIKGIKGDVFDNFHVVNLSGKIVYVEGHKGLLHLSKERIVFKVQGGVISVEGQNMSLSELSENTLLLVGEILKVERV